MSGVMVDITDTALLRADVRALRAALAQATHIVTNVARELGDDTDGEFADEVAELEGYLGWFRQVLESTRDG